MTTTSTLVSFSVKRAEVYNQIRFCNSCAYQNRCKGPVPFRGRTPSRFMMLGEAPNVVEDRVGRLKIGTEGRLLSLMLTDAGLPELDEWFVANVIACKPASEVIDKWAIDACQDNLRAQLEIADSEWILLLGATALAAVGLRGKLADVHGRWILVPYGPFKDRKVLATYNPATIYKDSGKSAAIRDDLTNLARVLIDKELAASLELKVGRNGKLLVPG